MTDTFLKLYTRDGAHYCFAVEAHEKVMDAAYLHDPPEWLSLPFACNGQCVNIRVSEIQSFFVSTPETRKLSKEWEQFVNKDIDDNEEREPWQ